MHRLYIEDWSIHFSFENILQEVFKAMCALHYETVPAVVRWEVSQDVLSTRRTWRLWCLMCWIPVHRVPSLSVVPSEVSVCPRLCSTLISTDTASASSRRNRRARCTAAWRWLRRRPCSSMPSRSDRNLQSQSRGVRKNISRNTRMDSEKIGMNILKTKEHSLNLKEH